MLRDEIVDKIKKIIKEDLGIDKTVNVESSLLKDGVMDSMDWISFLTRVEEEFGLEITPEDAAKYSVGIVNNLADYIKARKS